MQPFELTERESRPGCAEVRVTGELDLAVADRLDELLTRLAAEAEEILIDLGRCEFIDSSGIAVILRAHNKMGEDGKRLAIFAPGDQVLRVLTMTGLTKNGLVFESQAEALAASDGTVSRS
jgi:anti-sigma B factor antagonist